MSVISAKIPPSKEVTRAEQKEHTRIPQSEDHLENEFKKLLEDKLQAEKKSLRQERTDKNGKQKKEPASIRHRKSEAHKKNISAQDKDKAAGKKKEDPAAVPVEMRMIQNISSLQKKSSMIQLEQDAPVKNEKVGKTQPSSIKEFNHKLSLFETGREPGNRSFKVGSREEFFTNKVDAELLESNASTKKEKEALPVVSEKKNGEGRNLYVGQFTEEGKNPFDPSSEKVHYINLDGKMHRVGFEGELDQSQKLPPKDVTSSNTLVVEQPGSLFRTEPEGGQPFDTLSMLSTSSDKGKSLPPKTVLKEKGAEVVGDKARVSSSTEGIRHKQDQPNLGNTFQDSSGRLFDDEMGRSDSLDFLKTGMRRLDTVSSKNSPFAKALFSKGLPSQLGAGTLESPKFVAVSVSPPSAQKSGTLSLQLMPEVLGRLEVDVRRTHDGRLDAVVKAEKSETFELFKRDAETLKQVIAEAFGSDPSDMGFTLLDDKGTQAGMHHQDLKDFYANRQGKGSLSEDGTDLANQPLTNLIDHNRALDALV